MISDPLDSEVRSAIHFLNTRKVKPVEIHRQFFEVCGENVMSDGNVRRWIRPFNEERISVHDESRKGRLSVVETGLVEKSE
ncbi:HTH_48 domain-containing protein [Trichonephila clavipes]|nr:HTH_48 domain-containing protein [Trichonephila clavipes]